MEKCKGLNNSAWHRMCKIVYVHKGRRHNLSGKCSSYTWSIFNPFLWNTVLYSSHFMCHNQIFIEVIEIKLKWVIFPSCYFSSSSPAQIEAFPQWIHGWVSDSARQRFSERRTWLIFLCLMWMWTCDWVKY